MRVLILPPKGIVVHADSMWNILAQGLMEAGHEPDFLGYERGRFDALISINHQSLAQHVQSRYGIAPTRSTLIALEPMVTSPQMYTKRALRQYGNRFAASPIWAGLINAAPFRWPQDLRHEIRIKREQSHDATLINADKRSAVVGSLYGLRRDVVRVSSAMGVSLAHFGPNWDASFQSRAYLGIKACAKASLSGRIPQWREALGGLSSLQGDWLGTVQSKAEAFSRAPVSIVIENSADYVSEKLIDALRCGVVPVYVGPELRPFGIPESIVIKASPDASAVLTAVKQTSRMHQNDVLMAGREWLESEAAQEHEAHFVLHELGLRIGARLT